MVVGIYPRRQRRMLSPEEGCPPRFSLRSRKWDSGGNAFGNVYRLGKSVKRGRIGEKFQDRGGAQPRLGTQNTCVKRLRGIALGRKKSDHLAQRRAIAWR